MYSLPLSPYPVTITPSQVAMWKIKIMRIRQRDCFTAAGLFCLTFVVAVFSAVDSTCSVFTALPFFARIRKHVVEPLCSFERQIFSIFERSYTFAGRGRCRERSINSDEILEPWREGNAGTKSRREPTSIRYDNPQGPD